MIQLEIEPIEVYNETMQLEHAFVMFQTLANECYRLQMEQMRFKRQIATNEKYKPRSTDNRSVKKKLKLLNDYEMKTFDKLVKDYIKKTNFMCDSFASQLPEKSELMELGATEFMDKFLTIK